MSLNKLTPAEERVIVHKGTERPFTGEYDDFYRPGTYICRRCNAPLFSSQYTLNTRPGKALILTRNAQLINAGPRIKRLRCVRLEKHREKLFMLKDASS